MSTQKQAEYLAKIDEQINQAQILIKTLKEKRDETRKQELDEEIYHLESYLEEAQVKLSDISLAAGEAWEELKIDIEQLLTKIAEKIKKIIE